MRAISRLRRALAAAVVDAALASLASFTVGLYATRHLPLPVLGAYGVAYAATFQLGSMTVTQLYCTPVEVTLVSRAARRQLAAIGPSAGLALLPAAVLAVLTSLVCLPLLSALAWPDRLVLAAGAAAVATISPVQDHVRRLLHQAGQSAVAARTSAVQLTAALGAVFGLHAAGVAPLAIPLTALAAANAASAAFGAWRAHRAAGGERAASRPPPRQLFAFGKWMALSSQFEQLGGFVGMVLLATIAGSAAVGELEAARQLAQPLFVLAGGMLAVLRPRVMVAANRRDRAVAARVSLAYVGVLLSCGVLAAALLGWPWALNPLADWFPNAYAHAGVLAALFIATSAAFSTYILAAQLISARRERALVRITSLNQLVYCGAVAALAAPFGAMAMPIASLAHSAAWFGRARPVLRGIYGTPTPVVSVGVEPAVSG
ncbi:MAG: lipopolysaccharide biosynthesis protein [Acidimicrobiia bacterium]